MSPPKVSGFINPSLQLKMQPYTLTDCAQLAASDLFAYHHAAAVVVIMQMPDGVIKFAAHTYVEGSHTRATRHVMGVMGEAQGWCKKEIMKEEVLGNA